MKRFLISCTIASVLLSNSVLAFAETNDDMITYIESNAMSLTEDNTGTPPVEIIEEDFENSYAGGKSRVISYPYNNYPLPADYSTTVSFAVDTANNQHYKVYVQNKGVSDIICTVYHITNGTHTVSPTQFRISPGTSKSITSMTYTAGSIRVDIVSTEGNRLSGNLAIKTATTAGELQ